VRWAGVLGVLAPPQAQAPAVGAPLQAANGPIEAQRRPLAVRLDRPDTVRVPWGRPPKAGLLFDLDTGEVLWRRDPLRVRPIASVTKVMTALLAAEALPPSARVRFSRAAREVRGSRVGMFRVGQRVPAQTLLWGALLTSGNDAATALAQGAAGSIPAFVARMNARARRDGLLCTTFRTPHGLSSGDRSCAADLAALARALLDEPRLARIVRRRAVALPFPIRGGRLHLSSTNPLLRANVPGVLGIKTGYTRRAGLCLVAAVRHRGRRLGIVLLGSVDPGRQARVLLNRAGVPVRTAL
jgi:serine-type D-Ala-D-Ala carboxypeptidase (penicillin-binding protein 5/6)